MKIQQILLIYFITISLITVAVTVKDKKNAIKGRHRVPEKTLFILAFLGGSAAEYTVMKMIRHKTMHKSFMLGLPVIMLLQTAVIAVAVWLSYQYL